MRVFKAASCKGTSVNHTTSLGHCNSNDGTNADEWLVRYH